MAWSARGPSDDGKVAVDAPVARTTPAEVTTLPPPRSSASRIMDRIFPVHAGAVPPWSRVVGLIFLMALVWELLWLGAFWYRDPQHGFIAAWGSASSLLPIAVLLATIGALPGFWIMRRSVIAANERAGIQTHTNGKLIVPEVPKQTPRATVHASSRARRRHASTAKKRTRK